MTNTNLTSLEIAEDWYWNGFTKSSYWNFGKFNRHISGPKKIRCKPFTEGAEVFEALFKNYGLTTGVFIEVKDHEVTTAWFVQSWPVPIRKQIEISGTLAWKDEPACKTEKV